MDKQTALNWSILVLLVAAFFYPPLASLLGDGLRVLFGVGAAFAAIYLALRYPWKTAYFGVCVGALVASIFVASEVARKAGGGVVALSWLASCLFLSWASSPLLSWLDKKEKEAESKQSQS